MSGNLRERVARLLVIQPVAVYVSEALPVADAVLAVLAQEWRERREELLIEAVAAMTDSVLNGETAADDTPMKRALDAIGSAFFGVSEGSREP